MNVYKGLETIVVLSVKVSEPAQSSFEAYVVDHANCDFCAARKVCVG